MSIYTKLLTLEKLTTANKLLHINYCILVREREGEERGEEERKRERERERKREKEGEGGTKSLENLGIDSSTSRMLSGALPFPNRHGKCDLLLFPFVDR